MDTQALKAFLAVSQNHSFSIAAEKLHLTQPAISKRIASLELELNCKLFDRIARRIQLTEAGKTLLPRAKNILLEIKQTEQAIEDLSGSSQGLVQLATSHHIGLHRLPPILSSFTQQHPNIQIELSFQESEATLEHILNGELDFALITLPPTLDTRLQSQVIWHDSLVFVCGKQHPLATASTPNLSQLRKHQAILPDSSTYTHQIVANLFQEKGLTLNTRMPTNYLETIKMMVSVGLGWSVLPASMLDNQLHQLKLPLHPLSRELGIVSLKQKNLSNAASALKEFTLSAKNN